MKEKAKNISIFLPNGNPLGIKKASITTDKIDVIQASKLDFLKHKDLFKFTGIYILVDTLETEKPEIYIGKGKIHERLSQHNDNKDFWNYVFAIKLNTNEGFNKSHIDFMEHHFISKAKEINRCISTENKQVPSQDSLEEYIRCDIEHYLDVSETLLLTLGLKIFQDLHSTFKTQTDIPIHNIQAQGILEQSTLEEDTQGIFYCQGIKNSNVEATGRYTVEGFILFKGAKLRKEVTPSFKTTSSYNLRKRLRQEGIITDGNNQTLLLTKDYKCNSPSMASNLVLASPSNGMSEWKNAKGITLKQVYQQDTDKN